MITLSRSYFDRRILLWLVPVLILLLAFGLRLYHLSVLPFDMDGDFASCALEAKKILTGQVHDLTQFGWAGIPYLGYLSVAIGMFFMGQNIIGMNMPSVVMGTLMVFLTYHMATRMLNRYAGWLSAFLLAVSYAHIHLSRIPTYIDPVLFSTLAVLFLIKGYQEKSSLAYIISGISASVAAQMYFSGRAIIVVIGLVFLIQLGELIWKKQWPKLKQLAILLAFWLAGFAVVFALFLPKILADPNMWTVRSREVFIFHPAVMEHMKNFYNVQTPRQVIQSQLQTNLLMFYQRNDKSTQFGFRAPLLDVVTYAFFLIGIGVSLRYVKQFRFYLPIIWLVTTLIIGGVLTSNSPFWPRTIGLIVPATLIAGTGGYALISFLMNIFKSRHLKKINQALVLTLALVVLALTAFNNWHVYLKNKAINATERTHIARYLAQQPIGSNYILVSGDYTKNDREFVFLSPGRIYESLNTGYKPIDMLAVKKMYPGYKFILSLNAVDQLDEFEKTFTGYRVEAVKGQDLNIPVFYLAVPIESQAK